MYSRNLEPLATNSTMASIFDLLNAWRYCFALAASFNIFRRLTHIYYNSLLISYLKKKKTHIDIRNSVRRVFLFAVNSFSRLVSLGFGLHQFVVMRAALVIVLAIFDDGGQSFQYQIFSNISGQIQQELLSDKINKNTYNTLK